MSNLLAAIICGVAVGWIASLIKRHIEDRMHGRVPGIKQPKEYTDWLSARKNGAP